MQVDYKNIWKMTYPILISMLMQQLIGITDVIFLGRLGEVELGASALGSTYFFIIFMVLFGFSVGAQIIMARRNGEHNYDKIGMVFYQGCSFLIVVSFLFVVLSYCLSPILLKFLIQSDLIYKDTLKYINWRIWGLFAVSVMIMSRAFFVSIIQTKVLTYVSVVMVLSNIVLNYILIFGKFGMVKLGISGAAIASDLAEIIAVITYILYFILKVDLKKYVLTKFVYRNFKLLKSVLAVSVWTMLQQFVSVSTWFLFFIAIEHLGERELAISNIVRSLSSFPFVMVNAFAATVSSLISNKIGEGKTQEVIPLCHKVMKLCGTITLLLLICMGLSYYPLLRIYTDNQQLIAEAIPTYLVMVIGNTIFIPAWLLFNAVSGTGNTKYTMKIEFMAMLVYIMYVFLVIEYFKLSLPICWISDAVYNTVIFILSYYYIYSYKWCNKKI